MEVDQTVIWGFWSFLMIAADSSDDSISFSWGFPPEMKDHTTTRIRIFLVNDNDTLLLCEKDREKVHQYDTNWNCSYTTEKMVFTHAECNTPKLKLDILDYGTKDATIKEIFLIRLATEVSAPGSGRGESDRECSNVTSGIVGFFMGAFLVLAAAFAMTFRNRYKKCSNPIRCINRRHGLPRSTSRTNGVKKAQPSSKRVQVMLPVMDRVSSRATRRNYVDKPRKSPTRSTSPGSPHVTFNSEALHSNDECITLTDDYELTDLASTRPKQLSLSQPNLLSRASSSEDLYSLEKFPSQGSDLDFECVENNNYQPESYSSITKRIHQSRLQPAIPLARFISQSLHRRANPNIHGREHKTSDPMNFCVDYSDVLDKVDSDTSTERMPVFNVRSRDIDSNINSACLVGGGQ